MTTVASWLPAAVTLAPFAAVIAIYALADRPDLREAASLITAAGGFVGMLVIARSALGGVVLESALGQIVPGIGLTLRGDPLGVLFGVIASGLWLITTLYSIGYMRGLDEHAQTRYFAAFAASVGAAFGVALSANLLALFIFYEVLTVATYPLVAHDQSPTAQAAGRKYLVYTFGGGVAVFVGTAALYLLTGTVAFTPGGIAALAAVDAPIAQALFAVLIAGFGVKAALIPVHSWLPDAMVAPTPVSGLLHAVAVVKSGVFGIARVILEVFGPARVDALGVGIPLAVVAAVTIVTASVIALRRDNLKRRLAYSTISQLSYIVLGLALFSPAALLGGLLHIPAHAFMKLTLFFCAGTIHVETHTDNISEMAGIGRRLPLTMGAFGVAVVGMAGLPLVAGFVSKWYLLIGTVEADVPVFAGVLVISGLLNIAYFWPVVYQAFFERPDAADRKPIITHRLGGEPVADGGSTAWERRSPRDEASLFLLVPIVVAVTGAVLIGIVPAQLGLLGLLEQIVTAAVEVGV